MCSLHLIIYIYYSIFIHFPKFSLLIFLSQHYHTSHVYIYIPIMFFLFQYFSYHYFHTKLTEFDIIFKIHKKSASFSTNQSSTRSCLFIKNILFHVSPNFNSSKISFKIIQLQTTKDRPIFIICSMILHGNSFHITFYIQIHIIHFKSFNFTSQFNFLAIYINVF